MVEDNNKNPEDQEQSEKLKQKKEKTAMIMGNQGRESLCMKSIKCAFTEAFKGSSMEPLVDSLRSIRDNGLKRTRIGTLFVNSYEWIYYRITREVVKVVMKNHRFKNFWKKLVAGPVVYFLTGIVKIISTMRHRTMKLVNI